MRSWPHSAPARAQKPVAQHPAAAQHPNEPFTFESVQRLAQPRQEGAVPVVRAAHGAKAEMVGALVAARDAVLETASPR